MPELWTLQHDLKAKISLYDADDLVGYADGDPIGSCPDVSLEGNDLAATFTSRPTYRATQINGGPAMEFNGTSNQLTTSAHTVYAAQDYSFIFLLNPTAIGGGSRRYIWDSFGGGADRLICLVHNDTTDDYRFFDGGYDIFGTAATGWQVLVFIAQTAGGTLLYKNGVQVGGAGVYTQRALGPTVALGAQQGGGAFRFTGHMKTACVMAGIISTADRQRAEGALLHRIGQQALLPGGHPYETTPPLIQAWRSELGWSAGELVRAAKLRALSRAHGRTRVLAESLEGVTYADATPKQVRAHRVRSGHVLFNYRADATGAGVPQVECRIRRVSDAVVVESDLKTFNIAGQQHRRVTLTCPVDEAVTLEVEVLDPTATGLTIQDIQISEIPGTLAAATSLGGLNPEGQTGAFADGIPDAAFSVAEPEYMWSHAETGDSADLNIQINTLPKSQMHTRSLNGASFVHGLTTFGNAMLFEVDKLCGSRLWLTALMQTSLGVNASTVRIMARIDATDIVIASTTTLSTTPVPVNCGAAVPAGLVGRKFQVFVQIAAGTGETVTLSSVRVYSGETSSAGDYMV